MAGNDTNAQPNTAAGQVLDSVKQNITPENMTKAADFMLSNNPILGLGVLYKMIPEAIRLPVVKSVISFFPALGDRAFAMLPEQVRGALQGVGQQVAQATTGQPQPARARACRERSVDAFARADGEGTHAGK